VAGFDAAAADYHESALPAFQQVEDNLAALRILEAEAGQQHQAVASAQESLQLFSNRYMGGVDTYLQVVTSQTAALENERNETDIQRRRMDATPFAEMRRSLASKAAAISSRVNQLTAFIRKHGYRDETEEDIETGVGEALANAITHDNREDPQKRVYVTCGCAWVEKSRLPCAMKGWARYRSVTRPDRSK
jgi:hypothetical protein